MDIGRRIRAARKRAGLSQEEVARRAGMSLNGMANIERGLIPDPHISSVRSIADALGVAVGELFGESVPLAPAPSASPPPDVGAAEAGHAVTPELADLVDGLAHAGNEEVLGQVWRVLEAERNRLAEMHIIDDPENAVVRGEFARAVERLAYATLTLAALREAAKSSSVLKGDGGRIA